MNRTLRKTLRSTLSVILVVAMVLSSTAMVFAVEPEKKLNIVSLGDSMTTAFGYDDYYLGDCGGSSKPEYKNESGHMNVRGFMVEAQEAYPAKVIDSLESAGYTVNFNQLAANALRMNDLYYILNPEDYEARKDHFSRRLLDEDSDGEEWFAYWGNRAAANYKDGDASTPVSVSYDAGKQNGLEVLNTVYKDALTDADVITLNVGYNNFGVYLTGKLTDDLGLSNYRDYTEADSLQACINRIGADVDVEEVKAEIYGLISENLGTDINEFKEIDLGAAKIDLDSYVDVVLQAYIGYAYYFTRTIDQITEWNPDAKIIVVGLQNTQRGLVVRVNGQDIDLGEFYGKLLDMANVYAALVSPNNDKYYFVDLADVLVERLFDELAGDFTEYSDDLKHRLFEGIASFGLDDMINGMIMSSPDFMNGIYSAIVAQSGGAIPNVAAAEQYFNSLDAGTKNGYINQALSTARSSFGLTGAVDAAWLQEQYDAFVSDPYHATLIQSVVFKIVDILAASARVEYVDFDEATAVLGAAGGDMVGAIGSAIANYVGGGELNDGIKGLLCIYVRLMLSNGIWVHPSEDGHQTVADEILKVLNPLLDGEDVDTAREYAVKKLASIIEGLVDEYGDDVLNAAVDAVKDFDDTYAISQRVINAAKNLAKSLEESVETLVEPAIASAVTELNNAVEELENLIGESYNKVKETIEKIEETVEKINQIVKDTAEKTNEFIEKSIIEVNEAIKAFDKGVHNGIENLKKYVSESVDEKIDEINNEIDAINSFLKLLYDASTSAQYVPSKNSYYLAIGDSIATGLGLEGSDGPDWNAGYGSQLDTAYPQILAEMFGLNDPDHHNVIGMGGVRVEDILYILDPNAEPDDYFTKRTIRELQSNGVCYWGETAGGEDTLNAARAYFASEIGKADLITLTLGGNNFGTFVGACMDNYLATGSYGFDIDFSRFGNADIAKMLEGAFDNGSDAIIEALRANGAPEEYLIDADTALAYAKLYVYAYLGYAFNYGNVVEAIHAYNPDALVVLTGLYNSLSATYFEKDGIYLPAGDIVGVLVDAINLHYLGYAMYSTFNGHQTVYVDITNTKMFADEDENRASANFADGEYLDYMTADRGKISHPSKEGQKIIAQDIYDAIAGENENPEYEISGNVTSYINAEDEVTVRLLDADGDEYASVATTDGTYSLEAVAGDYTIEVSKYGHATREYTVTVEDEAVTQDLVICPLGDATLDGVVNASDLSRIYVHIDKTRLITDEYALKCANVIDVDNIVNARDLSRVYAHVDTTEPLWSYNTAEK